MKGACSASLCESRGAAVHRDLIPVRGHHVLEQLGGGWGVYTRGRGRPQQICTDKTNGDTYEIDPAVLAQVLPESGPCQPGVRHRTFLLSIQYSQAGLFLFSPLRLVYKVHRKPDQHDRQGGSKQYINRLVHLVFARFFDDSAIFYTWFIN